MLKPGFGCFVGGGSRFCNSFAIVLKVGLGLTSGHFASLHVSFFLYLPPAQRYPRGRRFSHHAKGLKTGTTAKPQALES
jgi:hypothetical protein